MRGRIGVLGAVAAVVTACAAIAGPVTAPTHPAARPTAPVRAAARPTTPAAAAPKQVVAPVASSPVPSLVGQPGATHAPRPSGACRQNAAAKQVRVSLRRQRLWLCARHAVVLSAPITSGMTGPYTETPTGTFAIQGVSRDTTLTLLSGQQYQVRYWIPFDPPLFGFHDAPWQRFPFGSRRYRTDGSHGCVHLPLKAIAFLARWAPAGTPVRIAA